ncbi:MAG: FAD-binding oxidoreductase [Comamonas sp.]|uniref:FAD-binding oxidoreductase n=1 Tax=Comamonas sp. TaxID=34028 RepID=UPI002FC70120
MLVQRRCFLARALAGAGLLTLSPQLALATPGLLISNVTGLYSVMVAKAVAPSAVEQLAQEVRQWPGQVAVGGGRFSMGGQIACAGGLHLDMRELRQLVWLDANARTVRVQAGMTWRDLQERIDPLGLAVTTMQSFANFTIGGSVAVNAHGRYVGNGPLGNSVRALQIVLADGAVVEATRRRNAALFRAAIGGYGALGVISEVELDLAQNVPMERSMASVALEDYPDYFLGTVRDDPDCILHNADLLPPLFDAPVAISWRATSKPLTETARLIARGQSYDMHQNAIFALTELPCGPELRTHVVNPLVLDKPAVVWRNHEASHDVAELEPRTRRISTYVLQEYFIPVRHLVAFVREMAGIIRQHGANVLNVSIRHSPADELSLLPWARQEVFSLVVYYKQRVHEKAHAQAGAWTRAMIDAALQYGGRYYLPYQLHATREQFLRAYPEVAQLRQLKQRLDPQGKFSNQLWSRYL